MNEAILVVWLMTGQILSGPASPSDCHQAIDHAIAMVDDGVVPLARRQDGLMSGIVRMQCDGRDVILALPPSSGPCEAEAMS